MNDDDPDLAALRDASLAAQVAALREVLTREIRRSLVGRLVWRLAAWRWAWLLPRVGVAVLLIVAVVQIKGATR